MPNQKSKRKKVTAPWFGDLEEFYTPQMMGRIGGQPLWFDPYGMYGSAAHMAGGIDPRVKNIMDMIAEVGLGVYKGQQFTYPYYNPDIMYVPMEQGGRIGMGVYPQGKHGSYAGIRGQFAF